MKALRLLFVLLTLAALAVGCSSPLTEAAASGSRGIVYADAVNPGPIGGPDSPLTVPLYAGRTIDVGTVEAWLQDGCLYVRYTTTWSLAETHLAVAADPAELPQTSKGNPIPGQFAHKMSHDPGTTTYTYAVAMAGLEDGATLYLAAHAEVQQAGGGREGAWAAGYDFPGANWATYFAGVVPSTPTIDLTGYWDIYLTAGDETMGPEPFFVLQTATGLDCSMGMSGTVEGTSVTIGYAGQPAMTGTVSEAGDEITGTFYDPDLGQVDLRMVRSTLPFGTLFLGGPVKGTPGAFQGVPVFLETDHAFASLEDDGVHFNVHFTDQEKNVYLWFGFEGFVLGSPGPAWLSIKWQIEENAILDEAGTDTVTLTIEEIDEFHVRASFEATSPDGSGGTSTLVGGFDIPFSEFGF